MKCNANNRFNVQNGSSLKQQQGPHPSFSHNQSPYPGMSKNYSRPTPQGHPYNRNQVPTHRRSYSRSWSRSSSSSRSRSRSCSPRSWTRPRSRLRFPPRCQRRKMNVCLLANASYDFYRSTISFQRSGSWEMTSIFSFLFKVTISQNTHRIQGLDWPPPRIHLVSLPIPSGLCEHLKFFVVFW